MLILPKSTEIKVMVAKQKIRRFYAVHVYVFAFEVPAAHIGIGDEVLQYAHEQCVGIFGL